MGEQHTLVRHRDHVVVECACLDRLGVLFDEHRAFRIEPVHPRDCAAGLLVLACGEFAAWPAIDEHLDSCLAVAFAKSHVVGRALVPESGRHRVVDCEVLCITEGDVELRLGVLPFLRAMEHCDEVGWGQVAAPVARVGRGRHGGRIGGPHGRGGPGRGAQGRILCAVER